MGAATAIHLRELIVREKESGKSLVKIADEQNLSYSTTCNIWRLYKAKGLKGLKPKYNNCGPKEILSSYRIYRMSKWLKRRYPNWGAPFIKTILEERYPQEVVPSVRTLQIWFKKAGYIKPKFYREEPKEVKVESTHDCWQIDAKEHIKLADGTKACYLTTVDVKSGSVLATPIFSQRKNEPSKS